MDEQHVCAWAVHGLDYEMVPVPGAAGSTAWPVTEMRFRERQYCTGCGSTRLVRLPSVPEDEPVTYEQGCMCLSCRDGKAGL